MTDIRAKADEKKNKGNAAFQKGDFSTAIKHYSEAIAIDGSNHVYFSNRSACYSGLKKFQKAADDGEECVRLNKDFVKGYHRLAIAYQGLGKYKEALDVLKAGQKIDFNNKDLNKLTRELEESLLQEEMSKRADMNTSERLKEEGNDAFKAAQFDRAIELYTKAIKSLTEKDKNSALAVSCYNNRAACHQQMSNYSAVIGDCSKVLEIEQGNQKALLRRGLAYEGLERYRLALEDIRALLAIDPTIEIANRAQHRIGNAVRELQKSG